MISHSSDDNGTYFIWKSYTESGTYSRTGLGIALLNATISDEEKVICSSQYKFDVDCCQKDGDLRKVEIWWKDFGDCQPYIMYGGDHLCKMPEVLPFAGTSGLMWYAILYGLYGGSGGPLYAIPDVKGGCLPFTWIQSGPGKLYIPDKDTGGPQTMAYYQLGELSEIDCHDDVNITLADRCGTTYNVLAESCCAGADELVLVYTTLLMACSQQQTLYAQGGCAPYTWRVTAGGGTIEYSGLGYEAIYYSPATNPNCTSNPTITLTDCCGASDSISLAVNCYVGGIALGYNDYWTCGACVPDPWPATTCNINFAVSRSTWDCNGTLTTYCETAVKPACNAAAWNLCNGRQPTCTPPVPTSCWSNACGCGCGGYACACNVLLDCRTPTLKANGCCPINPLTGLPY